VSSDSSSLAGVSSLAGRAAPGSAIELYAREKPGFDGRVAAALQRLKDAAQAHPGRIVQATSLGAEDMVVTDLIARHGLPIALATLDTGALHAPTVELMGRLEQRYGLPLRRFQPVQTQVVHFVATNGPKAMYDSLALRKACCALRKLEPLQRLLAGHTAWVTGLRREQSDGRAEVPFEEAGADARSKFNPLADWSWADVWHYIRLHDVPFNPLHDAFMPSIGCEPCTRAIAVGEPFRAGRWWWEEEKAKECGLHVADNAQDNNNTRSGIPA
jgi:phosphoadenosine phosphosulfate reductase